MCFTLFTKEEQRDPATVASPGTSYPGPASPLPVCSAVTGAHLRGQTPGTGHGGRPAAWPGKPQGEVGSLLAACRRAEPFLEACSWPLGPAQAGLVQGNGCAAWGPAGGGGGGELEQGVQAGSCRPESLSKATAPRQVLEVSAPPPKSLLIIRLLSLIGSSPLNVGSYKKEKQ